MYNINQNYQKAINAPSRRIRGRVTIKNKVLSDGVSSIDYISSITGNEMSIGSTNASTVDIKFKTLIEGLQERELIKVSFTIETESGLVERQIGEFYLTEIKLDRNNKTTAVKAVDKMAFLNDQFKSTISYPALGKNIVQEIVNDCNLRVNNNLNISNLPSFDKKLEKVSYREMLGYLAQTVGAFVVFNNRGELEFRKLIRTEKRISKSAYLLKGLEVDEVEFRINGISVDLKDDKEKKILVMGSPLGTQVNLSNPLMTQGLLNSIYSEYKNLRFNPFKLNWRGDPFVEVGDWVSIEVSNGTYKAFPILSLKISFSGGLKSTISANVKGTASLTTEYKGTVQRQIEFINARLGSTGNLVYADTTEPKNPSEGDVWFKPNGAFTDLYIFEKGKWVLKTSTGDVEGLVTQITKSEILTKNFAAAIAKIIELDANRITTGSLSFEKLSSKAVNSIREGLITKSKLSEFLATDEGIHQILQSEVNKEIEKKKPELKGKDGKIPAFNQLIGTRFPTLAVVNPVGSTVLKLNKKDYKDQNSIEVLPNVSNEVQGFSLKANIRDVAAGKILVLRIPVYIYSDSSGHELICMGWPDENNNVDLFQSLPLINGTSKKDEWQLIEMQFPISNNSESKSFVQNRIALVSFGSIHFKIAEPYIAVDEKATDKWLPAIEDMQSYSLTASARIEGSYLNDNLSNCKVYLDVYNNGEIVRASTTETLLKIEIKKLVAGGYTASGEVTLDSNGLVQNINIPNGTKDGQPIEVVFEVTCGENKTVASARLNNTIDKQLLTETISKVKTFESTIDKFESKIGEINKQKFKMAYNIENICSESGVEKKGNDLYFNAKTPLKKDKEYYILADLEDVPDNQNTRIYDAKNNGDSKIISNSLNVWRVSYASDQTRVNIYPLGTNTKVKNVEIYEVPEFENPKENLIKTTNENFYNQGNIVIVAQETLVKNDVYTLEFEVGNSVNGSMSTTFFNGVTNLTVKKPLVKGLNKLTIRGAGISNTILVSIPTNLSISNVKFYKEKFNTGYKNEYNITEMESKINQTKEQIEQSVKKNEFGTVLTQNAQYLKLAWNNISKYIQFENAGMSFYEDGQVNDNKLVARLNDSGYQMWRDGYYLGSIGTNSYKQDRSKKGIQFDLNYDGWFMGWAYQTSRNADTYTWKWVYSSGNFATYKADTLNAGCDIDMHNYEIKNVILKSTNITVWDGENGTFRFSLPVSFQSDGRAYQWHDNCYLTFKNGLLIDSSMPR
jgi:hypothetical protein